MLERPKVGFCSLLASFLLAILAARGSAQVLPTGFVAEPLGDGWQGPVGLCFLGEGELLVAERGGRVWYVEEDPQGTWVKKNLVYDIEPETLVNGDRGLLGIAAHPDFDADGGWLYLLLVVDVQNGEDRAALGFSRLVRVLTEYDGAGNLLALPATRQHLLGDTWSTGIASCHLSHTIGSLRFLSDGSLVLTTGDNAHFDSTDAGGQDPRCFDPGRTPPDQDVGAYRSQYDNTLCGKVLRLDAETGRGCADNPFFTGDADALLSRVFARGLRNPFRFTLLPGSGPREALLVSDVGWNLWEEINLSLGGENFGWPCYEGDNPQAEYQSADVHGLCVGVDAEHARPLLAWHHSQNQAGFRGNCASGLCVYSGERYPEVYRGRLFFSDYGRDWMRAALLDEELRIPSSISFARELGGPVDLVAQPGTGDLVYAAIGRGVFRLRYLGGQLPPTAVASATPAFGSGDLLVRLSAAGSSDPENQALAYAWDLGDGNASDARELEHAYAGDESYVARVTVTDSEGLSDSAEVRITPNNTPPVIDALLAPRDGDTFVSDEPLRLAAAAHDAEDGVPKVDWTLDLVHDHHLHPDWASDEGLEAVLTPDAHGPGDNHFRVRLRVTDSRGLTEERTVEVYDRRSLPQAHLAELPETRVRVGQVLAPLGHVDFALGRVSARQATLTWDWGDGTSDVFAPALHHVDTRPEHAYRLPGRFKLRLIAELEGDVHVTSAVIEVLEPRPAVAVFAPLEAERWVPRAQQEEVVAELALSLAGRASEVRGYSMGEGAALAAWMESFVSDPIADVLVLLDFVPAPALAGGIEGSLLQRWVEGGNGLVWSGTTPLLTALDDEGTAQLTVLGAETFFGATSTGIVQGVGIQTPSALAAAVVPSLASYRSERALRYDRLGPDWSVARIFAEDGDQDSDALELAHVSRGYYAQFLCDPDPQPRAAVLSEYLRDRIGKMKAGMGGPGPVGR
jgi:glucose/arabinose dehydrogenase/PKD repeat protein